MREIEVVVKCDICLEAKDLHWDGMKVTIEGIDYVVDACEFDVTESERTLQRFFTLITERSRRADGAKKKKKAHVPSGQPPSPLVDCEHCGKPYRKFGMALHITRAHPEVRGNAA